MNQKKLMSILSICLFVLQIIAEVLVGVIIWKMNVLPPQYGIILVLIALLLTGVTGVMCFVRQKNDRGFLVRQAVACFMAVLVIFMSAVVATVAADIFETLSGFTQQPSGDMVNKTVFVLKDDPAKSMKDAYQYRFGYVNDGGPTNRIMAKIKQEMGSFSVNVVEFDTIPGMLNALTAKEVEAIVWSQDTLNLMKEDKDNPEIAEQLTTFASQVRVLYDTSVLSYVDGDPVGTIPPTTQPSVPATDPTEPSVPGTTAEPTVPPTTMPPRKDSSLTEAPFVVYIGGSDGRGTSLSTGRNDVNIIAVVNPETKQVLLVNTPRDAYLPNPAYGGALDKLTHCGNNGLKNTTGALSALYNVSIDHTAHINFSGFETLIDAIGGISVYSPYEFKGGSQRQYTFIKGTNQLDGKAALAFARERYNVPGGDFGRGDNQMRVIKAVVQKVTSDPTLMFRYNDILKSMQGMFKTSVKTDDITALVRMQLDDMADWEVFSYSVQGNNASRETCSAPGWKLSVVELYSSHVSKAHNLMAKVLSGQLLTENDVK